MSHRWDGVTAAQVAAAMVTANLREAVDADAEGLVARGARPSIG